MSDVCGSSSRTKGRDLIRGTERALETQTKYFQLVVFGQRLRARSTAPLGQIFQRAAVLLAIPKENLASRGHKARRRNGESASSSRAHPDDFTSRIGFETNCARRPERIPTRRIRINPDSAHGRPEFYAA